MKIDTIEGDDDESGDEVEFEQPEVAHNCTSVFLKIFLDGSAPPVAEWYFNILIAAWALLVCYFIYFAGHGGFLM